MSQYPWVERHHTFLHNRAELDRFVGELMQEADQKFGKRSLLHRILQRLHLR